MICTLLVFALCAVPAAVAQEPGSAGDPTELAAPRSAAPATVLEHEVRVVVDASRRATTTTRWVVRVDDPQACAAGLIAPDGLDGASDGDGMVLEDALLVGESVQAGTVYTLENTVRSEKRGAQSGAFLTAPDLPTDRAVFHLTVPGSVPLHVWHDSAGEPDIGWSGGRTVEVAWSNLPAGHAGETVWSTHTDWMSAGTEIAGAVDGKLATKQELGREISSGYTGLHVGEAAERVNSFVEVDPNGPTDWTAARDAADVLREGRGSPVDRGVVLISLLRLAGYEAHPGYFRPARARGSFPITIPAPALLGHPMIAVEREKGRVFIDPASDAIDVPELPASLRGGVTWLPGDLPTPLVSADSVDGHVTINGAITIGPDGSATWTAQVHARGAAEEYFRELLAPLDEKGRSEAIQRLVTASRPELGRFKLTASGVEKTRKKLDISISGRDEGLLEPIGAGLMGEVPSILAPALASWLPPNVTITESMSIAVPQAVELVAATPPSSGFTDAALLARRAERSGSRVALVTEVTRPYRVSTAGTEVAARAFLDAEAARGPYLVLHAPATRDAIKALRAAPLDPVDKLVLEGVLWYRQRVGLKTARTLRTAINDFGADKTIPAVRRYAGGERRVWEIFANTIDNYGTPAERLAVARAIDAQGFQKLAWMLAAGVATDDRITPEERGAGLIVQAQLQPKKRPPEARDPQATELWREPDELVTQASQVLGATDPRVLEFEARRAMDEEDWAGAIERFQQISGADRTARIEAMHAQALAESDAASQVVAEQLESALAGAPDDPDVLGAAAAINARIGRMREAKRYALTAARLDPENPERWDAVVRTGMAAGDLPTARIGASKAAELETRDRDRAETLALVSALMHDEDGWKRARTLNPEALAHIQSFPPPLQTLMEIAPPDAMLAVLQQHDAEVIDDPALLGIRAQMRLDAGLLDEASRDGVLLATRHGMADGVSLAFAASAGRMYSTTWTRRLDDAARQSVAARSTRMEVALIVGSSDPYTDATQIQGDPRAEIIQRLRNDPKGLAAEVPSWPVDARSPTFKAPSGYRTNARLGASPGVTAVSNRETFTAILRTAVADALPAPLHQLYTPSEQILAELPGGGTVVRLDGGPLPLYLARALVQSDEPYQVLAIGFSESAAARTLSKALETP